MPPIERQASTNPALRFFARKRTRCKHKKAAPVSSSGKKPAQPDRCETMQQVLERVDSNYLGQDVIHSRCRSLIARSHVARSGPVLVLQACVSCLWRALHSCTQV